MRILHCVMWCAAILLAVINASYAQDSLGMRRVSTLEYWQDANDIQMVGDTAYVVSGESGLHIMDLSDPANPVEIGRCTWYDWGEVAGGVYVTGNRAYVATGGGLLVFDISDPTNSERIGQLQRQELGDIFVYGNIAIVEGAESYPEVFDISDLDNIQLLMGAFGGLSYPAIAIGMIGEYLCMRGEGLTIWDISNPAQPFRVSAIDTTFHGPIAISGHYAYFATFEAGLRIIDLTNPLLPEVVAVCDSGTFVGITVTEPYVLISTSYGLHIWNITNPTQPVFEGTLETQRHLTSLAASGTTVCAANYRSNAAVTVVDISDPTAPVESGVFGTNGWIKRLSIQDTIGYIASSSFTTLNLSDPTELSELGRFEIEGNDCAMYGDYGYLSGTINGIEVLDISNPARPESLSCISSAASRIEIAGGCLYGVYEGFGGGSGTLYSISLQNPVEPEIVSTLALPNGEAAFGFAEANGNLYYGGGRDFIIFSIADPETPQQVGSVELPFSFGAHVEDIVIEDDFAFVAYSAGGLRIIDISDPTEPFEACWMDWLHVTRVAVSGTTLLIDHHGTVGEIMVMDITNPISPTDVGYYFTDEWLRQMTIAGPYLFTLALSQMRVYEVEALTNTEPNPVTIPQKLELNSCYPNPFNPITTISFSLPHSQHTTISVYDPTGRKVSTLADEVMGAGEHAVTFDASGLPSGIYFARLEAGGMMQTTKMVMVK